MLVISLARSQYIFAASDTDDCNKLPLRSVIDKFSSFRELSMFEANSSVFFCLAEQSLFSLVILFDRSEIFTQLLGRTIVRIKFWTAPAAHMITVFARALQPLPSPYSLFPHCGSQHITSHSAIDRFSS